MAMNGTTNGATRAPTFEPLLKMPVASARSFFGNHSAIVLMEAGKLPASPKPTAKPAVPKPKAEPPNEWQIAPADQKTMAKEKALAWPNPTLTPPTAASPNP